MYCNLFSLITEIELRVAKHTFFCSYKAGRHAAMTKKAKEMIQYSSTCENWMTKRKRVSGIKSYAMLIGSRR